MYRRQIIALYRNASGEIYRAGDRPRDRKARIVGFMQAVATAGRLEVKFLTPEQGRAAMAYHARRNSNHGASAERRTKTAHADPFNLTF